MGREVDIFRGPLERVCGFSSIEADTQDRRVSGKKILDIIPLLFPDIMVHAPRLIPAGSNDIPDCNMGGFKPFFPFRYPCSIQEQQTLHDGPKLVSWVGIVMPLGKGHPAREASEDQYTWF